MHFLYLFAQDLVFFDNFPVKWLLFIKQMYNFAQKYIGDVLTTYNVYVTYNAFSTQNYNNLHKPLKNNL